MNPIQISIRPLKRLFNPRLLLGAIALASILPASALEVSYRYYQFKTYKMVGDGPNLQLGEFGFSRGGTPLNINNKNGSGTNVVPATALPLAGEPVVAGDGVAGNLFNGTTASPDKFVRRDSLLAGRELVFDFGTTPPVIDSYSFSTAFDSADTIRVPQTWILSGSQDGAIWTPVDVRVDAITTRENLKVYSYALPEITPPWITSFGLAAGTPAIIRNGESVTLDWITKEAADVQMFSPAEPAGVAVATSGSRSVTPVNNRTSAYTLAASKTGVPTDSETILVRTVAGGSKTYQYVRYLITERRGTLAASKMVQLAEFEFYNGDSNVAANKVAIVAATNTGGDNLGNDQVVEKLFDGTRSGPSSKWLDANNAPVIFDFGSRVTFDRYLFVTAEDAMDRDPIKWVLEGSDDQVTWEVIENVDFPYPTATGRNVSSSGIPLPGASLVPVVELFTGDTPKLISGQVLNLTYSTRLATSISLTSSNPNETLPTNLPLSGTLQVSPTVNTTYTLTASAGTITSTPLTVTANVVADPGFDEIAFDNFADTSPAFVYTGTTAPTITAPDSAYPNRLRLTEDAGGRLGTAWFIKKLDARAGFEATFGLSMNKIAPADTPPADGIAFIVQNSPQGANNVATGESGVAQNALNICFSNFGTPQISVRSGTEILSSVSAVDVPGLELYGMPGFNVGDPIDFNSLATLASSPPYNIRVVYTPGDLDLYIDGIAVLQNVPVNLTEIGATDASGKSFFGFSGRTGSYTEANDITNWNVKFGDFSALPEFSLVKHVFYQTDGLDMVWNAKVGNTYEIQKSFDLITWDPISDFPTYDGIDGQIGSYVNIFTEASGAKKAFFRVQEVSPD